MSRQRGHESKSFEETQVGLTMGQVRQLASAEKPYWPKPYDKTELNGYLDFLNERLRYARVLVASGASWRKESSFEPIEQFFKTDREDHPFRAPRLAWDFSLTEPMATRGLVGLLNMGNGHVRSARILAFLKAIGVPHSDMQGNFEQCLVVAEEDRVDMKFTWENYDGNKKKVIVEAKFGKPVESEQLNRYYAKQEPDHAVLLVLDPDKSQKKLKKLPKGWKIVAWRDLWFNYVTNREVEHNESLSIFLRSLWHRMDRFEKENNNGTI